MQVKELVAYIDDLLKTTDYNDYAPNGLQIAGVDSVERIVTGVSANLALIDAAIQKNADVLLVHHGFFWKGEEPCITGIRHGRFSRLIKNDINLIAYHLPLDGHDKLGNNAQLADVLELKMTGEFQTPYGPGVGRVGSLKNTMSGYAFAEHVQDTLGRTPLYIPGRSEKVEKIAWCTGGAPDLIFAAAEAGADAYLTGEVAERTVAFAEELGLHFYAAGHHATELYGVQALGEHLAQKFKLEHTFVDISNAV